MLTADVAKAQCPVSEFRDGQFACFKKTDQFRLSREPRTLSYAASENCASLAGHKSTITAASLEKAFSGCESRVVKMTGAIYGRTVSSVPKRRWRRLVMSFEMVRLNRASSEPLYQQLFRQIREELESGSFDSSASRVPPHEFSLQLSGFRDR